MLNNLFKSRLSKLSSKKMDDQVVQEFVLTYVSTDVVQLFLQSLDETYELSLRHPFISNNINWKKISFDVRIPFLQVKFDALTMVATLVGVNVSRKVMKDGEIFKYELVFHKEHDPEIDSVFAITYLNRKEEDDSGKKVFLEYETIVTPFSRPVSEEVEVVESETTSPEPEAVVPESEVVPEPEVAPELDLADELMDILTSSSTEKKTDTDKEETESDIPDSIGIDEV